MTKNNIITGGIAINLLLLISVYPYGCNLNQEVCNPSVGSLIHELFFTLILISGIVLSFATPFFFLKIKKFNLSTAIAILGFIYTATILFSPLRDSIAEGNITMADTEFGTFPATVEIIIRNIAYILTLALPLNALLFYSFGKGSENKTKLQQERQPKVT